MAKKKPKPRYIYIPNGKGGEDRYEAMPCLVKTCHEDGTPKDLQAIGREEIVHLDGGECFIIAFMMDIRYHMVNGKLKFTE